MKSFSRIGAFWTLKISTKHYKFRLITPNDRTNYDATSITLTMCIVCVFARKSEGIGEREVTA